MILTSINKEELTYVLLEGGGFDVFIIIYNALNTTHRRLDLKDTQCY